MSMWRRERGEEREREREDEKCADVKMICADVRMRRCEDVEMISCEGDLFGCEDGKTCPEK